MITPRLVTPAERLATVRDQLAQLHQTLLEAERRDLERERGRIGSTEYLGLLLNDPRFAWLRPIGRMLVRIDEFVEECEADGGGVPALGADLLMEEVRQTVQLRTGLEGGWRYQAWLQRDPAVVLAHAALHQSLRQQPSAWAA